MTYGGFGEAVEYTAAYGGSNLFTVAYSRDKLGRVAEKTETVDGMTDTYEYGYDLAGRLVGVSLNGATVSSYGYDSNGNRTSYSGGFGPATGSYDAQDRLLAYGNNTYTYTANGELASKTDASGTTSYVYDALGNLQSVSLPNGTSIQYVIDGRNRRIGKKVNGTLVQGFLYDGQLRVVAELDGGNNVVSRFVYGSKSNIPDYMMQYDSAGNTTGTYGIVSDHLGSPRLVVDINTGIVVQRMAYDEFGNVIQDSNPGFQPFGFAGGLYDPDTGLVRFGARDYDAFTGRWTAKDPILFAGGDTNLYGYVVNDPVNFIDPSGLAKGGKQNIGTEGLTKASPLADVQKALEDAIKNKQTKRIKKLRALEKVIKRGGGMCIIGVIADELLFPNEANAGEDEILDSLVPGMSMAPDVDTSVAPGQDTCEPIPNSCQ